MNWLKVADRKLLRAKVWFKMADQKLVAIHYFSILLGKIFLLELRNLQFIEKVSSLVHFDYYPGKHGS